MHISLTSMFMLESVLVAAGGIVLFNFGFSGWAGALIAVSWGLAVVWPVYYIVKMVIASQEQQHRDNIQEIIQRAKTQETPDDR
ncbi:MAG: hypothetical protein IH860_04325 [Chloroflexi bacterium]|nr:hypothetical protein [Chloroflexota bacterium]